MFGNPDTTTGGNALKFYASVRLDIRRNGAAIKDKEGNIVANHVKVKVKKNKLAPPFREAEFDITFGKGISKVGEIVDLGVEYDIIKKSGSWYAYKDAKIAQGREAAKRFMEDNPEVALEIEEQVKKHALGFLEPDTPAEKEAKAEKPVEKVSKKKLSKNGAAS